MLRSLILVWTITWCLASNAQDKSIRGTVTSESGMVIPHTTVTLRSKQSNLAVAFTTTNVSGQFKMELKPNYPIEDILLEVSHLSYKRKHVSLQKDVWEYEITLEESPVPLDSIAIKSKPKIAQKGDTINYRVEGFAREEDRSIGDVLSRIPGIDVGENGEIRFNNRPISHFYIDGDDLLGGKYGIGSKTIPHEMVNKVQVYTNHEHIKVKKDRFNTNAVALNLEIKEDARLTLVGIAKIGGGLPKNYDSEVNTILLNKQFKMLNSAKANNIGDDLSVDVLDLMSNRSGAAQLVHSSTIAAPFVPRRRYFINHSGMVTTNNAHRFKNDLFVRTNLNYLLQNNKLQFNGVNEIYTQTDTIRFEEYQEGNNHSQSADLDLFAEMNKPTYYLKNDLKFDYGRDYLLSDLYNNQIGFEQSLRNRSYSLSNQMNYIPILKNNDKLELDWSMKVNRSPQRLQINPGIFPDIINGGVSYQTLNQHSHITTFSSNIGMNYRIRKSLIEQKYGVSFQNRHQSLSSQIRFWEETGTSYAYRDGTHNNALYWDEHSTRVYASYRYKKDRFQTTLDLPVRYSHIAYRDTVFRGQNANNYWLFEPAMNMEYQVNPQDKVMLAYDVTNSINDITSLYQGYIFVNYRTFQRNESFNLWTQHNHSWQLDYHIKRPIKMIFAHIGVNYSITNRDILNATVFEDNMQKQIQIPYSNQMKTLGAHATLSKYIFFLGATIAVKPGWINMELEESINNELYLIDNNSYMLSTTLDFQLFNKVSMVHRWNMTHSKNSFRQQRLGSTPLFITNSQIRNNLSLTYSPLSHLHLKAEVQSVHIRQTSTSNIDLYFVDLSARWKLNRWRSDVEFYIRNIADNRSIMTYAIYNNSFVNNNYALNPRMGVLKYVFSF